MLVPAPLEGIANPEVSPNPAKAPWYFMGIQELLLHFHPAGGGDPHPRPGAGALFLLPFYDITLESVGVYFRSLRGRALSLLAAGLSLLLTPAWVLLDEYLLDWTGWLPAWPSLISNGLIPLALVLLGLLALDEWLQSGCQGQPGRAHPVPVCLPAHRPDRPDRHRDLLPRAPAWRCTGPGRCRPVH